MTPDHLAVPAVSRRWYLLDEPRWRRLLAVANLLDVPLLALIGQRYEALRAEVAREAFETQRDFCVVAWEWRRALAEGQISPQSEQSGTQVVEIRSSNLPVDRTDRNWSPL